VAPCGWEWFYEGMKRIVSLGLLWQLLGSALLTLGTAVAVASATGCATSPDDTDAPSVEAEGADEGDVEQTAQALFVWKRTRYYYRNRPLCERDGERVRREYGGLAWQCRMATDICEAQGGKGATCQYQRTYVRVRD
jgi:hypothetical protein